MDRCLHRCPPGSARCHGLRSDHGCILVGDSLRPLTRTLTAALTTTPSTCHRSRLLGGFALAGDSGCLGAAWYSTPLPASSQRIHPVNGGWLALISSASPKPIGEYQERVGFDNDRDHTSRRSKVISDRHPPASQYRARAPQLDAIRALPPPTTHARATKLRMYTCRHGGSP